MLEGAENFHNELITWVPLEGGAEGPFPMDSLVTLVILLNYFINISGFILIHIILVH